MGRSMVIRILTYSKVRETSRTAIKYPDLHEINSLHVNNLNIEKPYFPILYHLHFTICIGLMIASR